MVPVGLAFIVVGVRIGSNPSGSKPPMEPTSRPGDMVAQRHGGFLQKVPVSVASFGGLRQGLKKPGKT